MENYIINQAKEFARIVGFGSSNFEKLKTLKDRFETELNPYISIENRKIFLESFKDGIINYFSDHISKCQKKETCPQHKTYNNSIFLINQELESINSSNTRNTERTDKVSNKNIDMDVFISHSSQDQIVAKVIVELIRTSLNIPAQKIRCTSVSGYKLPIGANTDIQLREEMLNAKVLIGIISQYSIQSTYVLLEFGARWGANLPLLPLIIDKNGFDLLRGPLKGINALECFTENDLFQFIVDLSNLLGLKLENPQVYKEKLNETLIIISENNNKKFQKVEIEAYFKGGDSEWRKYLENNINGEVANKNGAPRGSYTVVIQFVINNDGYITEARPLTNHGFGMEEEALRIINKGPKWEPAIQNGRKVNAYRKQPITFQVL